MMKEQHEELSALMDDYHPDEHNQSLVDDLLKDVNQRYTLRRYQLISDVMRNEIPAAIQFDFSERVMAQVEKENVPGRDPAVPVRKVEKQPSFLWSLIFKPVAGVAVAATVAFVAVSLLTPKLSDQGASQELASSSSSLKVEKLVSLPIITNAVRVSSSGSANAVPGGMNWKIKRNEPAVQKKLNSYLINHHENSNSMQGIIPQVRVVGFDVQK